MSPFPALVAAALAFGAAIAVGRAAPRAWLAATLTGTAGCFVAALPVLLGGPEWSWHGGPALGGERLSLRLDAISALFLALLGLLGSAGTLYAREYWSDALHPRSAAAGRGWWSAILGCMASILVSSNGLHFLVSWELFTLCSYFLITLDRGRGQVRAAGWLYLAASHTATLCLFAFFAALASEAGSWELGPVRERPALAPLFWLALVGFGIKAGAFPLHVWLPSAHANAPSHVSALMSGVSIKLGVYGLVRFSGWLPTPPAAGWTVAALGVASAVLGVAFALGQHDLKRLLAYHSVENIGIILIGLGFALLALGPGDADWGRLALAGGLLHVWNHGLFKALLFLGAGSVLHATGTREMSSLGGLWRRMPWSCGLFALGAAAICGLPPLNGFVSEWLLSLGLFGALQGGGAPAPAASVALVLLAATGALALACFIKVCGVVFLGAPRSAAAARARECGPLMRAPMLGLAAACAAIGLAPLWFWPAVMRAAAEWNPTSGPSPPPAPLAAVGSFHLALAACAAIAAFSLLARARRGARLAPTWDCGLSAPSARMQYSAGSFAATIVEWFAWILRPVRHELPVEGLFPARALRETRVPETVLERALEPAAGGVIGLAAVARKLQHGRLQAYLFYLVAGLAALAWLVLAGGPE